MKPVDFKFTMLVGSRLEGFTVKSTRPLKTNFRCVLCGDSQKHKHKKRGWLNETPKGVSFHCFNCGTSMWLSQFIERVDPSMHNDYVVELKLEWMSDNKIVIPEPVKKPEVDTTSFKQLKSVSQLSHDHPVKLYILKRMIPSHQHYRLFFAPKFNKFVNSLIPNKLNEDRDEPRLVIPFLDENGKLFGFAGRSFKKDGLRYITIMLDETKQKVFGLDKVDFTKRFFVTEGPLDSLFIPNCIASADADLSKVVPEAYKDNAVIVNDNEKHNKEVVSFIKKAINKNLRVVIWPDALKEKDVNDMVLSDVDVIKLINENVYKGLAAEARLAEWRKC